MRKEDNPRQFIHNSFFTARGKHMEGKGGGNANFLKHRWKIVKKHTNKIKIFQESIRKGEGVNNLTQKTQENSFIHNYFLFFQACSKSKVGLYYDYRKSLTPKLGERFLKIASKSVGLYNCRT